MARDPQRSPAAQAPLRLAASFVALGLLGGLLLTAPFSASGARLPLVDALFTSVSAVCVTGLSTVDVSTDLSRSGQWILLTLIQLGALGISVWSLSLLIAAGRLTLATEARSRDQLPAIGVSGTRLLRWALLGTVGCELVGALLLWWRIPEHGGFFALFHAVSAFCNAGFSLTSDSLIGYQHEWLALVVIGVLVALGGLGFLVHRDCTRAVVGRVLRRPVTRLLLHTKLVLLGSLVLWLLGAVMYGLLENGRCFTDPSLTGRALHAVFQSVSARTAGFAVVDLGKASDLTLFSTMFLMFVGAGPGSVAGGIKITTAIVVLATLRARLRGSPSVWLFGRTVPLAIVQRSYHLLVFSLIFLTVALALLLATEEGLGHGAPNRAFLPLAFELVSAFGTVGLSTGITAALSTGGKLLLILTMLVGRIGPLVFAVTVLRPRSAPRFSYPEEEVATG